MVVQEDSDFRRTPFLAFPVSFNPDLALSSFLILYAVFLLKKTFNTVNPSKNLILLFANNRALSYTNLLQNIQNRQEILTHLLLSRDFRKRSHIRRVIVLLCGSNRQCRTS